MIFLHKILKINARYEGRIYFSLSFNCLGLQAFSCRLDTQKEITLLEWPLPKLLILVMLAIKHFSAYKYLNVCLTK